MNYEASDAKPLLDRVAIVTGSGQGIGRGVAMCLAHAGAHLVIADQVPERIASVTSAIEDLGVQALGVATDVSRSDDVKRMIRQTVERFGKIDILVNNAGTLVVKPMVEQTEEEWDRVLEVNLKGVFICCRQVLPEMIARKRGAIVNIASIAAFHVTVPHVPYRRVQGRSGRAHARFGIRGGPPRHPRKCDRAGADRNADGRNH